MMRLLILILVLAAVAAGIYYSGLIPSNTGGTGGSGTPTLSTPSQVDLYEQANVLYAKSAYDAAVASYRSALAKDPNSSKAVEARYRIGKALEDAKKPAEALKAYEEFVALYPGDTHTAQARTRIEFLRGTGAN